MVLQLFVNGLMVGGIYALVALGVVALYKSTHLFNFAVGEILAIGAYTCWSLMVTGMNPWLAIIFGIGIGGLLGLLIERAVFRRFIGQPILAAIMATLALGIVLRGAGALVWTNATRTYPSFIPEEVVSLSTVRLAPDLVWAFIICLMACGALIAFFLYTNTGLQMRGIAEDAQLAQAKGIRVGRIFGISWTIAMVTATIGGVFLGNRLGISFLLGSVGLKAFPAALLGGLDSIHGALIGGLIIGIVESLTGGLIAPSFGQIAPFVLLLIVLIIRPEGLFGLKRIERI